MNKITRKLHKIASNNIEEEEKKYEIIEENNNFIDNNVDGNFILRGMEQIPSNRFVVFSGLERGELIDENSEFDGITDQIQSDIITRPFIGRSLDVISLFEDIKHNKMVSVESIK